MRSSSIRTKVTEIGILLLIVLWLADTLIEYMFFSTDEGFFTLMFNHTSLYYTIIYVFHVIVLLCVVYIAGVIAEKRILLKNRVMHLNRVLSAVRRVDRVITHEKDINAMLNKICSLFIEASGYYHIWIVLEDKSGNLYKHYQAGCSELKLMKDYIASGNIPQCIKKLRQEPGVLVIENPRDECHPCPFADKADCSSSDMCTSLYHRGERYGYICCTLPAKFALSDEEQDLFREITHDIAFYIYSAKHEKKSRIAESDLEKTQTRLVEAMEAGRVSWWEMDIETGQVSFDNKKAEMLGYDPADFRGKTFSAWTDLIHEDDYDPTMQAMRSHINGESDHYIADYRIKGVNGNYLWFHDRGKITEYDEEDKPKTITGVVVDITGRKKSEARLNDIFYNSPIGIFRSTFEGRFVQVNSQMGVLLGFEYPDEVLEYYNDLGKQLYVNGRRRGVFLTMLKDKGVVRNFELQAWKKDASKIWVSMDARLSYDENGGKVIDGFIQDITSHKRTLEEKMEMEKRIRHNEKIDAIGKLSGGIAHDFNNILGGIIGYTEMALDDTEPGSRSERNLNKVLSASERAKQLVKQILSFSRQSEKVLSPTYLRPVIKEALEFMRASIPSSIDLTSYLEKEKMPVMANSGQIHEIIVNLCTNAVDSIGEKGRIHVRLTTKEWEPENEYGIAPGSYACLSVSDNGCGMDSVMQEHIFEPFYSSKDQGKGTGLGLSVVHGIVKEHYGHIFVESEKEKGSTFKMYFMKTDLPVGKTGQENKGIELGGDERVMLVDDEPMITEMFSDILTKLGYTVTSYNSSEKALDAFINDPEGYDIMITDQTMPELTGIELTELVHSKRDDLPVILCTGYSNTLDREAAINRGVADFSMKPLKPGDLASIIRRVLDKRLQD